MSDDLMGRNVRNGGRTGRRGLERLYLMHRYRAGIDRPVRDATDAGVFRGELAAGDVVSTPDRSVTWPRPMAATKDARNKSLSLTQLTTKGRSGSRLVRCSTS